MSFSTGERPRQVNHGAWLLVVTGVTVSCLPWDPRPDGGSAGGAAGASGGSSGGVTGGGSTAGGSAGGATVADGGGDYTTMGGCVVGADGGQRCHPLCRPAAASGRADGDACCLDDECQSGNCVGAIGARQCSSTASQRPADAPCGDETDCVAGSIGPIHRACDVFAQRCMTTLRQPVAGQCTVVQALICDVGGGKPCALPGAVVGRLANSTNPCCYDRCAGGRWCDCLESGTCSCVADQCNTTGRDFYTCPF